MPCLSGSYDFARGILLNVGVAQRGTTAARRESSHATPQREKTQGLVDTGAERTCISPRLAELLNLRPHSKVRIQTATGCCEVNAYWVDLMLHFGNQGITIENLEVAGFAVAATRPELLIGRDILCLGVLTMASSGHFTFSI